MDPTTRFLVYIAVAKKSVANKGYFSKFLTFLSPTPESNILMACDLLNEVCDSAVI